jgi:ABC-2 type transport system permease protein
MLLIPMFFISGALFPVSGLPTWLTVLNRLDPVTYAVDPIRHTVFAHLHISDAARNALNPGVTWWGWHLPIWFEVGIVVALGVAMLASATALFSREG